MKLNVVIPCRNEKGNIEECVEAIFNADLPNECSILVHVVDGMSDDGTIDIIHNLTKRYPYLKLIENKFQFWKLQALIINQSTLVYRVISF